MHISHLKWTDFSLGECHALLPGEWPTSNGSTLELSAELVSKALAISASSDNGPTVVDVTAGLDLALCFSGKLRRTEWHQNIQ